MPHHTHTTGRICCFPPSHPHSGQKSHSRAEESILSCVSSDHEIPHCKREGEEGVSENGLYGDPVVSCLSGVLCAFWIRHGVTSGGFEGVAQLGILKATLLAMINGLPCFWVQSKELLGRAPDNYNYQRRIYSRWNACFAGVTTISNERVFDPGPKLCLGSK